MLIVGSSIVPSTGVLRRHGFGGSFPLCVGSGLLPIGNFHDGDASVVDLDVGMCCSPASSSVSESVIDESIDSFAMSPPSVKLVKTYPPFSTPQGGNRL